jgi:hypothetical protein
MRYRSFAAAAGIAAGLAVGLAACGDIDKSPADGTTTTEHDMSKMQPGETMEGPTTTEHDMSKMQPGETMMP